eukprot:202241_1
MDSIHQWIFSRFIINLCSCSYFRYFRNIKYHICYSIFIPISVGRFIGVLAICFYKLAIFMTGAICGIIIGQLLWYLIALLIDMSKYTDQTTHEHYCEMLAIF